MQLCSRVIRTGCLTDVLEWGIAPEDFLTSEGRAIFNHIVGYYSMANTAGAVIGEHAAKQQYPNFQMCDDASMTTAALCQEVRKSRLSIQLKQQYQRGIELADVDPMKAAAEMQNASADALNLGLGKNTDVRFTSALDGIVSRYELLKQGVDLSAMKWPWQPMNDATGGIQHNDYIVFFGRPKSMKSWVLAYLIAWAYELGKRAVVYTKEMNAEDIFMRVTACISQITYSGLRMGNLSHEEEQMLYATHRMVQMLNTTEQLICLSGQDAPAGGDTVPWLRSKVESYKPDLVFIDGLYLMSDVHRAKKREERVMNISRELRQMTIQLNLPLLATLQANRKAAGHEEANLDELAYSDAIGQDATGIFRVINEKTGPTCQLVVGGAREFVLNGFRINAVPATDFSYHSLLTSKEIESAKAHDTEAEDEPKAHAQAKNKKKKGTTEAGTLTRASKQLDKIMR